MLSDKNKENRTQGRFSVPPYAMEDLLNFITIPTIKRKYGTKSISIWKYIDLLKENGCKPLLFWGVAGKLGWW